MSFPAPPQAPPVWNHTAEQILAEADQLIAANTQLYDTIAAITEPTFENVFAPFVKAENEERGPESIITFYQQVSTDKAIRDASTQAEEKLQQAGIEASSRIDVYRVWEKLNANAAFQAKLDDESKRLLKKVMTTYKRDGLSLPEAARKEVKDLKKKYSNLTLLFNKNCNEELGFLLFTRAELDGVPADVVDGFPAEGDKVKMTYKYPDVLPVLKYATSEETRKRAFLGNQNKLPANEKLLAEIIAVRAELAQKLGYETFSDYVLEERMAKTKENVLSFLGDLKGKLKSGGEAEIAELLKLKNAHLKARGLPESTHYYIWDHSYYSNLMIEQQYLIDDQKISEYFPIQSVVPKILHLYETLFNLKFIQVDENRSVWHEDVIQFSVWKLDNAEPEFVGWVYFDMHPRDGKYGHACNISIVPGYTKADGSANYPVTVVLCNFSKPTKDKPALLKHSEVNTLLHEVGHAIHDLMGKTQHSRFHGTGVSWDFVEAPSQMLEYWTWSPSELKSLSAHYVTGEPITDDLVASLIKTKHVNGGLAGLRQLHFALFDMTLHTVKSAEEATALDLDALWNDMREEISLFENGDTVSKGYGSFNHIGGGGYASGYYGYLYSEVFAADIYYTLFKADPMNVANGIRYRDTILRRGGSRDEMDNLVELLGRAPNSAAFLTEMGVAN
ncbi:hypothetical protein BABINDRAFT_161269 [Babjeviella inositovora NRRL Y-12698]|uniref:Peptidase M3A/M3B catalytic domain-containing protein n=1 Tax=Babjeviella inositovora NRRL Y-12698 TaxID=984486 RepID=A0A1E3QRI2_9ASCO|nr:uncharacterized protein BABINDRAFT_161269 [Babjeviella inositovora NRRL Y-12698]ODQ80313.1 hypothetical protein BABINDRAFT_161269 [Babjeviella inositovora NRRL Y-12698]